MTSTTDTTEGARPAPMTDGELIVALHEIAASINRICESVETDARQVQR